MVGESECDDHFHFYIAYTLTYFIFSSLVQLLLVGLEPLPPLRLSLQEICSLILLY